MTTEPSHLLSVLCASPLLAAVMVLLIPRQRVHLIRGVTVAAMLGIFGLALLLLSGDYTTASMQFSERYVLLPAHGITYSVGVDGLSLWLVLLTALITPIATHASWTHVDGKLKAYAVSFLILESAILGVFISLDLFVFYVFWELTLAPMFLIIGIWGGEQRARAALKFFLYTMLGSALMLVAILYLVAQYKAQTGHYSFELHDLRLLLLPASTQLWLFAAFAFAFAIKVPMVPFHTWLPDAYAEAPIGGSVMLSALMAKLATYGFLRFAMPLFPAGSHRASATLALLAVIGVVYGAYCARVQPDLKKLVAYSSVSHLGFVMLGIYTLSFDGLRGSVLQMVNHGISIAALFLLVGIIYERRRTGRLSQLGGAAKVMPVYAAFFIIVAMSAIGLPTTNGFIGEFMILAGAVTSDMLGNHGPVAAFFAATAMILAPIYMLQAVMKLLWGPLEQQVSQERLDLTSVERLAFLPLLALIFFIGLCPNPMLKPMNASVERFASDYVTKLRASARNPETRGILEEGPAPETPTPQEQPSGDGPPLAATIPRDR